MVRVREVRLGERGGNLGEDNVFGEVCIWEE